MNKLESTIPFDGFYESFISADIEHQIGQQIEWDSDTFDLNEDEQQILWDSYLSVNRSYFYNQIAEDYTNFYIDALNERLKGFTLKATYKFFTSPREYNFSTDRIFIEIEKNHAIDFIKYVNELNDKITQRNNKFLETAKYYGHPSPRYRGQQRLIHYVPKLFIDEPRDYLTLLEFRYDDGGGTLRYPYNTSFTINLDTCEFENIIFFIKCWNNNTDHIICISFNL